MRTQDRKAKLAAIYGQNEAVVKTRKMVETGETPAYGANDLSMWLYEPLSPEDKEEQRVVFDGEAAFLGNWLLHPKSPYAKHAELGQFLFTYDGDDWLLHFFKFLHLNLERFHTRLCFRELEIAEREADYGSISYNEYLVARQLAHREDVQESIVEKLANAGGQAGIEALFADEKFLRTLLRVVQYRLDEIPPYELEVISFSLTAKALVDFTRVYALPEPTDFDLFELQENAEEGRVAEKLAELPSEALHLIWMLAQRGVCKYGHLADSASLGICDVLYAAVVEYVAEAYENSRVV